MMVGERLEDRLLFYVLVVDGYDKIGRGFATIDIKDRRIYFCKTNKSIVGTYFLNFNAQKNHYFYNYKYIYNQFDIDNYLCYDKLNVFVWR